MRRSQRAFVFSSMNTAGVLKERAREAPASCICAGRCSSAADSRERGRREAPHLLRSGEQAHQSPRHTALPCQARRTARRPRARARVEAVPATRLPAASLRGYEHKLMMSRSAGGGCDERHVAHASRRARAGPAATLADANLHARPWPVTVS